jgi:O-Antigen ligase
MSRRRAMKQRFSDSYIKILGGGLLLIMAIAPFYTFLSIWLASRLHHLDFLKIWNELALTALLAAIVGFLVTHPTLFRAALRSKTVLLSLAFIGLMLGIGTYDIISGRVTEKAVIYGWLVDLRTIGIFLVGLLVSVISKRALPWRRAVMIPALIVLAFGFLQVVALPKDFLNHFGYGPHTTPAYETVDNQPDIVRIQSTLRGPNPLGAYIIIILTIVTSWWLTEKNKRWRIGLGLFAAMSFVVLYNTYSRSGEVGLILSLLTLLYLKERQLVGRHLKIAAGGATVLIIIGVVGVARQSYLAQNLIFHSSNKSTSVLTSNAQRSSAIKTGALDVWHHPLGGGIGSAGPASRRNDKGPVKIAENNYIQLGQEGGVAAMVLFMAINIAVGYQLWRQNNNDLAGILLASLVGLSFVAMVSHSWNDDALAYIWWGLAGIALGPAILTVEHKRHVKQKRPA